MLTVYSHSRSRPRSTIVDQSPSSSPTLPPPLPLSRHTSTLSLPSSTSRSLRATPPGCPSASPPTSPSWPSTRSPLPSSPRTLMNSSLVSRSRSSTPRTYASSPPEISTPTHDLGRASLPPLSSSLSTQGTPLRWAPPYAFSPAHGQSSERTPLIGTHSVRTAGASVMSPPNAPRLIPSAPSVLSTTPVPCTNAPAPPALEVATFRLLLAVALPHHHGAPTAKAPTLRLTGIVIPACLRPLSGVQPLPKRLFSRLVAGTRWTRPRTTTSPRPPLHLPAPSSRRSRWLLLEPEA